MIERHYFRKTLLKRSATVHCAHAKSSPPLPSRLSLSLRLKASTLHLDLSFPLPLIRGKLFTMCLRSLPSSVGVYGTCIKHPIYHIALLIEQQMVDNPFETVSDSFYFVGDRLIMHAKAAYAYDG